MDAKVLARSVGNSGIEKMLRWCTVCSGFVNIEWCALSLGMVCVLIISPDFT